MRPSDLSRRADGVEPDPAAPAHTVAEIKNNLDELASTLAAHSRELGEIQQEQQRQASRLAEVGDQITATQTAIQDALTAVLQRLDQR